jgi:hypothetical protein
MWHQITLSLLMGRIVQRLAVMRIWREKCEKKCWLLLAWEGNMLGPAWCILLSPAARNTSLLLAHLCHAHLCLRTHSLIVLILVVNLGKIYAKTSLDLLNLWQVLKTGGVHILPHRRSLLCKKKYMLRTVRNMATPLPCPSTRRGKGRRTPLLCVFSPEHGKAFVIFFFFAARRRKGG